MNFKKFFIPLAMTFVLSTHGYSAVIASSNLVSPEKIETPLPGKNEQILQQMRWFAGLTAKDYGKIRGKKLNFFERLSFKLNQHRVRQMLKDYGDEPTVFQKISWCFKGLILGPIALLLGYIFMRDEQRELLKWIWFGFAGWCIILALLLFSL